jgi:transcriptional regulator with XRE-family HTH domain
MMVNANTDWVKMSDTAIVKQLGSFIKHTRIQQNKTQAQLAEMAGLNRSTIGQIENGESVTLSSLIQVLRVLDVLYVLNHFEINDELSPVEYAKLQKKKRQRASSKGNKKDQNEDLGW